MTQLFLFFIAYGMSDVDLTASNQPHLRATSIALVLMAVFFICLRFTARRMKGLRMGIDDVAIIVALAGYYCWLVEGIPANKYILVLPVRSPCSMLAR